jgi:dimethylamine/trimethylamine dehydrogenase
VKRIADCQAPGLIAAAVFAGHRYGRELGEDAVDVARDRVVIGELTTSA